MKPRGRHVEIRNLTRAVTVAARAEVATSFLRRLLGLTGRRGWPTTDGLVIWPCGSVHCFFMRMPIDVLHVTHDGTVCRTVPNLRPWRIGPIVRDSKFVVELPVGTIDRTGTTVGDRISLDTLP